MKDINKDIEILEEVIELAKTTGLTKTFANSIEHLIKAYKELEEENKEIDLMAQYIRVDDIEENDDIDLCDFLGKSYSDCKHLSPACEDCIKQYFEDKVEREDK